MNPKRRGLGLGAPVTFKIKGPIIGSSFMVQPSCLIFSDHRASEKKIGTTKPRPIFGVVEKSRPGVKQIR